MEIIIKNLSYVYMRGTPFENLALEDVNAAIPDKKITGLIGRTGSGKSTLVQIIAGLLQPSSGSIELGSYIWGEKRKFDTSFRKNIGIVFQYPEHQLFAETVEKELSFGLYNFGYKREEIKNYTRSAAEMVGLNYDRMIHRSPFSLSGGEKRRLAIAGVIAYEPKILILDEPTVGLDPKGKKDILQMIKKINKKSETTVILISHSMDEVAALADKLIIMDQGKILLQGEPESVFIEKSVLKSVHLDIPEITKLIFQLNERVKPPIPLNCFNLDDLERYLIDRIRGKL